MAADEDPAPAASLEALQREHALTRMRLAEAIVLVTDTRAEAGKQLIAADAARAEAAAGRHELAATRGELAAARDEVSAAKRENERLAAALASAEAERAGLASVLAQDGHRLVDRAGAFAGRHPALRALLLPLVRFAVRLTGRR